MSATEVYERMNAAMTQPGAVFHTVIQNSTTEGPQTYSQRSEIWLDAATGRARAEIDIAFSTGVVRHAAWIIDGRTWYQTRDGEPPGKREASVCHGAPDAAVSLLLACRGSLEQSTTSVELPLTFDDQRAIALVTSGAARGAGEVQTFVDYLYLNAETYLPIALTTDGTIDGELSEQLHTIERFENGFVPKATLPANFFDAGSIGYVARTPPTLPVASDAGVAIVWPGQMFAPDGALPALVLRAARAIATDHATLLGYRAYLEYGPSDDEFAPPQVTLREWRRDEWDQGSMLAAAAWTGGACVVRTDITLVEGSATIFSGYRGVASATLAAAGANPCPSSAPNRFLAEVHTGETVALMDALDESAYNSVSGLTAIARVLTRAISP